MTEGDSAAAIHDNNKGRGNKCGPRYNIRGLRGGWWCGGGISLSRSRRARIVPGDSARPLPITTVSSTYGRDVEKGRERVLCLLQRGLCLPLRAMSMYNNKNELVVHEDAMEQKVANSLR